MGNFLHSVTVQEQAIAADGLEVFDLAVNPLSVILLHLKPLNDTGTLANFASYLGICGALNRVSVLHNGVTVYSTTGRDAAALAYFRHGIIPRQATHENVNNDRRSCVLPIILGKRAYNPQSCFPKTTRGELTLEVDFDIAATGFDGLRFAVETIELLGAKPNEFERTTQSGVTFGATGMNDVELPMGNVVRGLLLFGTTLFTGAAPAPTFGRMATFLDNMQVGFSSTDFEVAHMASQLMGGQPPAMDEHSHTVNAAGAGIEETTSTAFVGSGGYENYAFLDFDPSRDDFFSLDTRGASRFHLQSDAETANAVRVITVERIPLKLK